MRKTKIYYGRDVIGRFNCDGRLTLKSRIMAFIKKWVKITLGVCVLAWCLIGVFKLGQHAFPVTVYAEKEVPAKLKFEDIPMLVKICQAESGSRQFEKNGDVLRGRVDKSDIGFCQISERYNNDEARRLGYDIYTEKGNKDFAVYLYLKKGTQPWDASKSAWSKI